MSGPRSSFRSASAGILAALALIGLCSCGARTVWGIPVGELEAHLQAGEFALLQNLDARTANPRDARRLGGESPYYLSLIFRSLDMDEMERRMLDLGRRISRGVWREECELVSLENLASAADYGEVARRARKLARRIADPDRSSRLTRVRLEALSALGRDAEVLELLSPPAARGSPDPGAPPADPSSALYGAVAAARRAEPGWEERFLDLAWRFRSSTPHVRAAAFLAADPDRVARFTDAEADLLAGKAALAEGRTEEGASLLASALPGLDAPEGSVVAEEAGRAFLALARYDEGIALLGRLSVSSREPWIAEEFLGRLLRASGRTADAVQHLDVSSRTSPDPFQRQRALWHELDLRIQSGEIGLGRLFLDCRDRIADISFFDDLTEEAVTRLLEARAWDELESMRGFAADSGALPLLSRIDFILARAVEAGLAPPSPARDPRALLEEALAADPAGYHALLAGLLLGQPYGRLSSVGTPAPSRAGGQPVADLPVPFPASLSDRERYVAGFLRFGLGREGYRALVQAGGEISDEFTLAVASHLRSAGYPAESIRAAAFLGRRQRAEPSAPLLTLLYPALYVEEIRSIAADYGLPVRSIFGLVREESLFEPLVVSPAGAVGLMQLLPATAEEVAARLRLREPDLLDPATNLRLGIRHLAGLRTATGSLARAVVAYNAGLGRLRGWERSYRDLPEELFAEVIPFPETRLYLRRVVIASVMYGALYEGESPASTLDELLPLALLRSPSP